MPRECGRNVMDGAGDRHGGPGAEEKVLVVTGAGSGIGRAVARAFLAAGWVVVLAGRRRAALEETAEGAPGARIVPMDVADAESVSAAFREIEELTGRIDVLFNNAGLSPTDDGSVLDTVLDVWERVQAVNLRSVFLCCKHGIPHLQAGGGGSVRGYGFQRLGPRDPVFNDPIGGLSLAEFSLEARVRTPLFGGALGIVPFIDAGNIYTSSTPAVTNLRFGTLVTPLSRRRPWKVARETATLDRLSNGRLVVGAGIAVGVLADDGR